MLHASAIERHFDLKVGLTKVGSDRRGVPKLSSSTGGYSPSSSISIPRRSNGEKELLELAGKSLLLPKDEAFHPDAEGLKWRCERLIA